MYAGQVRKEGVPMRDASQLPSRPWTEIASEVSQERRQRSSLSWLKNWIVHWQNKVVAPRGRRVNASIPGADQTWLDQLSIPVKPRPHGECASLIGGPAGTPCAADEYPRLTKQQIEKFFALTTPAHENPVHCW